jgi:hypothetical protein
VPWRQLPSGKSGNLDESADFSQRSDVRAGLIGIRQQQHAPANRMRIRAVELDSNSRNPHSGRKGLNGRVRDG